jgi:hypothetical protein
MSENTKRVIYIIGSLRNKQVPIIANQLRRDLGQNVEIFDSWVSPGPRADDYLRDYCKAKGFNYKQTLNDYASRHIFEFDKTHLERATDVVLIMKAGKSCHLELGWALGRGKRGYVLFNEEPKRVDIMYGFSTDVFFDYKELLQELKSYKPEFYPLGYVHPISSTQIFPCPKKNSPFRNKKS